MDPVTQGILGASAGLLVTRNKKYASAAIVGALGGMAPDLDIVVRSASDPLLALEYHRQFTHSLLFIPFGGLLVAAMVWLVCRCKPHFSFLYLCATAGFATHALLDACTSYGTLLLWPFSHYRFAWDSISIIDPLVTLPLILCVAFTLVKKSKWPLYAGLGFFFAYMSLGFVQHHRAHAATQALANAQGKTAIRVRAMPTLANLVLWRTLYEADGYYYVNAVRVSLLGDIKVYEGERIAKFEVNRDLPELDKNSVLYKDIARFNWFTQGWLVRDPYHPNSLSDLRYSVQSDGTRSLWRIELDLNNPEQHVQYHQSDIGAERDILPMDKLLGRER